MSNVKIAIAGIPVYSCNGITYNALEIPNAEQSIGKVWDVADVSTIINLLKSKPKWFSLVRKPNVKFDDLE